MGRSSAQPIEYRELAPARAAHAGHPGAQRRPRREEAPVNRTLDWQLAGERVILHGDRALYYPGEATLMWPVRTFGKGPSSDAKGRPCRTARARTDRHRLSA